MAGGRGRKAGPPPGSVGLPSPPGSPAPFPQPGMTPRFGTVPIRSTSPPKVWLSPLSPQLSIPGARHSPGLSAPLVGRAQARCRGDPGKEGPQTRRVAQREPGSGSPSSSPRAQAPGGDRISAAPARTEAAPGSESGGRDRAGMEVGASWARNAVGPGSLADIGVTHKGLRPLRGEGAPTHPAAAAARVALAASPFRLGLAERRPAQTHWAPCPSPFGTSGN